MSPKEKAEDLVNKYLLSPIDFPYKDTQDGQCIGIGYMLYNSAKQCALIAVDEILHYSKLHGFIGLTEWYSEVRQEIEKL